MTADDLIKLLAATDVERVEMRPDGTVIVEKRRASEPVPYIIPWVRPWWEVDPQPFDPFVPYTVTWSGNTCGNIAIGGES